MQIHLVISYDIVLNIAFRKIHTVLRSRSNSHTHAYQYIIMNLG